MSRKYGSSHGPARRKFVSFNKAGIGRFRSSKSPDQNYRKEYENQKGLSEMTDFRHYRGGNSTDNGHGQKTGNGERRARLRNKPIKGSEKKLRYKVMEIIRGAHLPMYVTEKLIREFNKYSSKELRRMLENFDIGRRIEEERGGFMPRSRIQVERQKISA